MISKTFLRAGLLSLLVISPLMGAGNILVEGRVNTAGAITWPNISDGDENPNQTATQFSLTDTNYFTERTFRIRNTDNNQTLTVFVNANSPDSSSSQFSFPDFPSSNFSIGPNASREFRVRYSPVQGGGRTTIITILSNSGNTGSAERTYTFALRGESREGEISLNYNPSSGNDVGIADGASASTTRGTDFGQLRVGGGTVANNFRERAFYVRNSSSAPDRLRYSDAVIIGPNANQFDLRNLGNGTLGTGNNDNFQIRFNPTSPGVKTATFRIKNSDPNEDPYTFSLRGEGTAFSEIRVQGRREQFGATFTEISDNDTSAQSADGTRFDNTDVGSTRDSIFRVHNDGDRALTLSGHQITGAGASAFSFIGIDTTVPSGESRDFEVRFSPPAFGTYNATVTFNNNDPNESPFNFAIRGSGAAPEIAVAGRDTNNIFQNITDGGGNSPSANNGTLFGPQDISGGAAQKQFRISNTGNVNLRITGRRFIGDTNNEFSVSNLLPITGTRSIGQGENHLFTISFNPSSVGVKNVIFEMDTDDPNENPFTFDLRGEGIGFPEIRVQGRRRVTGATLSEIVDNDTTPRPQDGTEFNDTEVDETFNSLFRLHNDGDGPLTISGASINGGGGAFRFVGSPNGTINPGASRDFDIEFAPDAGQTYNGTVTFNTNDSNENPFNFSITGLGLASEILVNGRGAASQFGPILNGDTTPRAPDGTDFQTTGVGADEEYEFRIDNTGNKNLKITERRFLGDTENEWSVRNLLPITGTRTIKPGESHRFWIQFEPENVGVENVTFELRNDDPDEDPYTFALRGEGVGDPEIQVRGLTSTGIPFDIDDGDLNPDQDVTRFGKTDLNEAKTRNFRVKNDGTDTLVISSTTSSNPQFAISGLNSTIEPGESDDFQITFTPIEIDDDIRSTIELLDNVGNIVAPYRFAVTGIGEGPVVEVFGGPDRDIPIADGDTTPEAVDLTLFSGLPTTGANTTVNFLIRNTGNKNLQIARSSGLVGNAAGMASFSIDRSDFFNIVGPRVIAPGSTALLPVIFDPSEEGLINATISLDTNTGGSTEVYRFAVRGLGLDPDAVPNIQVRGGPSFSETINSGDTTPRTQDGTDFGTVAQSDNPVVNTFQVRNTSVQSTLTISGVGILPSNVGFSISQVDDSDLDAEGNTTFQVTFNPGQITNGGQRTAIISISSDDPDTPTYAFTVRAEVEAPTGPPSITGTSFDGNDLVIEVEAPAGVTFKITSSTTLQGPWSDVPGQTGLSSGTIRLDDIIGHAGSEPKQFFRVERE